MSEGPDANVRILVVEDDPHVRQMLALLLGARWRVEMADGGEAARDMALASPPDLVISDVRMPGIDGIELLRALRAAPATHDVPVILVSARAGERETIAGLEAGADDFLIKPFSGRELMVRVQARLDVIDMRRRTTRQDEALASLQRHSEWTEKLLDSLPVPLWLLEPASHRVLFANHAARRMTVDPSARSGGLGERLALSRPDDEGGGAVDVGDLMPADEEARVRGRRVVSMTSEGSVWLLADAARLPALHDHPAVAVLSLRDVTELVRKEDLLRSALHVRDEFLSVASHELRTPITTLSLQTESAFRSLTAAHADGADQRRTDRAPADHDSPPDRAARAARRGAARRLAPDGGAAAPQPGRSRSGRGRDRHRRVAVGDGVARGRGRSTCIARPASLAAGIACASAR